MSVNLNNSDFQRLTSIIAQLSTFQTVADRVSLLSRTLQGQPRGSDVRSLIAVDGIPLTVATNMVQFLIQFGRITYDKEALGILLNQLLMYIGDEEDDAVFIRQLLVTYQMDKPVTPEPRLDEWHGDESFSSVQEKIIGENTLQPIYTLAIALEVAQAVVHIATPTGSGTGFIVGPNLLMTNNHVITSQDEANNSTFSFFYEADRDNKAKTAVTVATKHDGLFVTDPTIDFTVVELASVPEGVPTLKLKSTLVQRDARVSIIQHPGGHLKQISMQNNFVVYADANILQYTTTTLPGSSGSPVLDDKFEVVAIHHSGGMLTEPPTNRRYLRNAGSTSRAIRAYLREQAPTIFEQLGRN